MKKMIQILMGGFVMTLILSGCASSGMHMSSSLTNVELSEANYQIVARSVSGEAKAGYILGASFGVGMYAQVFGVARVSGDKALYKTAMDHLWENFEAKHGSVEGRNLALVNVRYDVDALNLIVYTQPVLTIQADIIEFLE
ncbi:hypothetical protein P872_23525 [Rhodonellum psychrophilum GCM71 = DSM 17998]|uniref:Uncharacterized protein n=2 Tax=Rhodonellum TaxID=336827 RepID=U5C3P9_9BACT|nr:MULTISPECIES: DUF6567 family protein [Rhodonellum]ERM84683.1 hypothetical protein P872_23525 [Rhodonellum psychrophilum GCM71 = DSM 17998]SDZ13300.1 hypothetical protein SAMN05444412_106126 [Rhodonellum ikkaensis]